MHICINIVCIYNMYVNIDFNVNSHVIKHKKSYAHICLLLINVHTERTCKVVTAAKAEKVVNS